MITSKEMTKIMMKSELPKILGIVAFLSASAVVSFFFQEFLKEHSHTVAMILYGCLGLACLHIHLSRE